MPRKKRKNRQPRRPARPLRFAIGDLVRARPGVRDPDLPAVGLGGWSGLIVQVNPRERPPLYLVEWDERTRAAMHPAYREHVERAGLVMDAMWLAEDELGPAQGSAPDIEPLSTAALATLGAASSEPAGRIPSAEDDAGLPPVNRDTLEGFHALLGEKLKFPFDAWCWMERGQFAVNKFRGRVTHLLPVGDDLDPEVGLLCEIRRGGERRIVPLAEVNVLGEGPNLRCVAAYQAWFYGTEEQEDDEPVEPPSPPAALKWLLHTLIGFTIVGLVSGGFLVGMAAALPGADQAALVGAVLLGLVGGLLGAWHGPLVDTRNHVTRGRLFLIVFGSGVGALVGAVLGVMVIGFLGAIPGAIAGGLLSWLVRRVRGQPGYSLLGIVAGALAGTLLLALLRDAAGALAGVWTGALCGAASGAAACVLVVLLGFLVDLGARLREARH